MLIHLVTLTLTVQMNQCKHMSRVTPPTPPSPTHKKGCALSGSDGAGEGCHPSVNRRAEAAAGDAVVTGPSAEVKPLTPSSSHYKSEPLHCWGRTQLWPSKRKIMFS